MNRIVFAVAALSLMPSTHALADTFQVTKTADTRDGRCDADCSLREAVIAANANPGSDTIDVPAGTYVLRLTGVGEDAAATGDLDITDTSGELRLTGGGADETIIDGNNTDRVFEILPDVTAIISGVTVRRGNVANPADPGEEDIPVSGGGILNRGTLTITDSTIDSNQANDGGGIDSPFTVDHRVPWLTVLNSTVSNNYGSNDGGGITVCGNMVVANSTFRGNCSSGGAIFIGCTADTVKITGCTFTNNGEGSCSYPDGVYGGAVFIDEGTVEITNSTLSGNSADNAGGGILNGGQLTITNSTFRGNSAPAGGGIYTDEGTTILLRNTIFASEPTGGNCSSRASGSIIDGGHNLDDGTSCGFRAANGSLSSTNPLFDPAGLKDNGGPTQTIALLPNSPAINAGDQTVCSQPPVNNLDQRGYGRPGAGATSCSIGAYEYNGVPPSSATCVGDCDGSGAVTVNELITLVNIALGNADASACPNGIPNGGSVDITVIIQAVNVALTKCPLSPAEQACLDSGATVASAMCCADTGDFPDTCAVGACGCAPDASHAVRVCTCGARNCFNGSGCVSP